MRRQCPGSPGPGDAGTGQETQQWPQLLHQAGALVGWPCQPFLRVGLGLQAGPHALSPVPCVLSTREEGKSRQLKRGLSSRDELDRSECNVGTGSTPGPAMVRYTWGLRSASTDTPVLLGGYPVGPGDSRKHSTFQMRGSLCGSQALARQTGARELGMGPPLL